MAGRPRLYSAAAEKTAAYRARQDKRLVLVDRDNFEYTQALIGRLIDAVIAADRAGDPIARTLRTITRHDLLATLAAHFEDQAKALSQTDGSERNAVTSNNSLNDRRSTKRQTNQLG